MMNKSRCVNGPIHVCKNLRRIKPLASVYWHLAELCCHSIVQTNLLSEFLMNAANINDEATSNNNDRNVNNSLVKL